MIQLDDEMLRQLQLIQLDWFKLTCSESVTLTGVMETFMRSARKGIGFGTG